MLSFARLACYFEGSTAQLAQLILRGSVHLVSAASAISARALNAWIWPMWPVLLDSVEEFVLKDHSWHLSV